ncbi:MAG: aminotransferase, partial [Lachnospiraceae bacterium]|nr:aminotransferase [Lachnospiraceae bacterium]
LKKLKAERALFTEDLSAVPGLLVIPSQADYLMVGVTNGVKVSDLRQYLFEKNNILIKDLSSKIPDGRQFMRLAIRNREENAYFTAALKKALQALL